MRAQAPAAVDLNDVMMGLSRSGAGAIAVAVASNNVSASNPALLGPAAALNEFVTLTPVTPAPTGTVRVDASAAVTGVGGTGVAGDVITYGITVDGALLAAPLVVGSLNTALGSNASLTTIIRGLTKAPHTFGIRATDSTGGHTIESPIGNFSVTAQEVA